MFSGEGPPGYKIVHVHLFIRHGDRSPMYTLPNHKAPSLSCSLRNRDEAIEFISTMDAVRTSLPKKRPKSYLNRHNFYPDTKVCNGAMLTDLGALQHLSLGRHLHKKYIVKLRLLQTNNTKEQLYVRSTDYSRTFQSALALVHGLQPGFDLSELNLDIVQSTHMCSHTSSDLPCKCQTTRDLLIAIKKEERRRQANDSAIMTIKAEVGQVLAVPPSSLPWVSAILEVAMTHICHDLPLPCVNINGSSSCISWQTVGKMWSHHDKEGLLSTSNYAAHRRDRLLMHPLLYEVANRLLHVTRNEERTRVVLYSGHDLTLTPLLKVLGLFDGRWPPYASRLALETWRNHDNEHFIRVVYNGEDVTSSLRLCDHDELVDGLCPLDKFIYFVRYKDIQFFGKSSYAEACGEK
ncbi:hypothetical protein CAPTEDRAFT_92537 [Capitella teleta]|uniref:2-phosphoxylose phosphatase 1 n=1 Tax=Capitella teleta TaxID=283909 RepID=R7TFH6_CAPTE|nr:hypothetical protein CAPTEDRAFT_92537 [Capitella teleta]|eukprot:ELT92533.1 hypothetical protein CAPTEDRAFT_92537 [Capitella teleta]